MTSDVRHYIYLFTDEKTEDQYVIVAPTIDRAFELLTDELGNEQVLVIPLREPDLGDSVIAIADDGIEGLSWEICAFSLTPEVIWRVW